MIYKGYILKHPITNEIRYVGITSKELEQRLKWHILDTKDKIKRKWYKSCWMLKVYKECKQWPSIELVDVFDNLESAKQFEVNYITTHKEEYNLTNDTPGGDYIAYNAHSRETILKKSNTRKIVQYNIFGELLHIYDITEDAVRALGLTSGSKITMCCRHKRRQAHGYIWRYYEEELGDINNIDVNSLCFNDLLQCDNNGDIIKVWDSYINASKAIGDNSKGGNIAACINGKQKTCKGFIWKLRYKLERSSINSSNSVDNNKIPSQALEKEKV